MSKIVIFDMDGTLLDSRKDITISINHIRNLNHSLPPLSEEFIVESINKETKVLPKLFYETQTYEKKDMLAFEEHYRVQCTQHLYLYDGIKEMLLKLQNAEVKLSVATNAPSQFAKIMLSSLDVDKLFDTIIGADKVKNSKPNPEMLHKVLDSYSYNKSNDSAWMIGDSQKDMQSAKNADINALFASWGFSPNDTHDIVLKNPNEIVDIVL